MIRAHGSNSVYRKFLGELGQNFVEKVLAIFPTESSRQHLAAGAAALVREGKALRPSETVQKTGNSSNEYSAAKRPYAPLPQGTPKGTAQIRTTSMLKIEVNWSVEGVERYFDRELAVSDYLMKEPGVCQDADRSG